MPPNITRPRPARLSKIVRTGAWVAFTAIAVLSLVPGDVRPATGASGKVEHLAAYLGCGGLMATAYASSVRPALLGLMLALYGAVLETLQVWVPGREAAVIDFLSSSLGGFVGTFAGSALASRWIGRHLGHEPSGEVTSTTAPPGRGPVKSPGRKGDDQSAKAKC